MKEVFSDLAMNITIACCLPKEGRYGDRLGIGVARRYRRLQKHVSNPAP
jgi:hypothetical protein